MAGQYKPKNENGNFGCITTLIMIVIIIAAIIVGLVYRPINKVVDIEYVTVTVTDKGIKRAGKSGDKYLIYTKDDNNKAEVFEITDSLVAMQFNSSDIYAGLEIGRKYRLKVGGSRNQLLSWYPNIYGYELIENEDKNEHNR